MFKNEMANGCSYSDLFIFPNLKKLSAKEAMTKEWYVGCKFYDPVFKDKYPKGYFWRKKGLAEFKTFKERKDAAELLLDEMQRALDNCYNPLPNVLSYQDTFNGDFSPENYLIESLELALQDHKANISHGFYKSLESNLKMIKPIIIKLKFDKIPIKEIQLKHVKKILDNCKISNYSYNKYRKHLSVLFKILCANSCLLQNPCENIPTRDHLKKERVLLTKNLFREIYNYLLDKYPHYANYMQIFCMSGCRSTEMLSIKKSDVNLSKQEFSITVKKRKEMVKETRIIIPDAIPFWKKQLDLCKTDDYFLFGESFAPELRDHPRCSDSPGKYWTHIVNKKFNTNTTFYSIKHYFLDMVQEKHGMSVAQKMAGHLNGKTTEIYTVFKKKREMEELKHLTFNSHDYSNQLVNTRKFIELLPEQLN